MTSTGWRCSRFLSYFHFPCSCLTVIFGLTFLVGVIHLQLFSTNFIILVNYASLSLSYALFSTSSASSVDVFQLNFCFVDSVVNRVDSYSVCPKWSWFCFKRKNSISAGTMVVLQRDALSLSTFFGSIYLNSSSSSYSSIVFHDMCICIRLISCADVPDRKMKILKSIRYTQLLGLKS